LSFPTLLAIGAIAIGGITYEAGNILGAVTGASLITGIASHWLVLGIGIAAASLLWRGNYQQIAQLLGIIVAIMGLAFGWVVIQLGIDAGALLEGLFIPQATEAGSWLVVGLIGTTIVPYNLFLGSGIQQKGDIGNMRWGLIIAIALGGIISMVVLIAATALQGSFSLAALGDFMESKIGLHGKWLFGIGLFAAGFSSALTAPLAASIAIVNMTHSKSKPATQTKLGKLIWITVLVSGLAFGLGTHGRNMTPELIIIAAQILNGLLLPIISMLLLLLINDPQIMRGKPLNGKFSNAGLFLMVGMTSFLGISKLGKMAFEALEISFTRIHFGLAGMLAAGLVILLAMKIARLHKGNLA